MKLWLIEVAGQNVEPYTIITSQGQLLLLLQASPQFWMFPGPAFELLEELFLLALTQRRAITGLLAFIHETPKVRLELLNIGRRGDLRVMLKPLHGGGKRRQTGECGF
jgi:hypothetical protein